MENYQKLMEKEIQKFNIEGKKPRLLLHSCCAPCSSYVLEYLNKIFEITVFYYNPNISPEEEYEYRKAEQIRLIGEKEWKTPVEFSDCDYEGEKFFEMAKGMENLKEGGERCFKCYELRLRKTASTAKEKGFDYFTTTLSISPLKNAEKLNEIGKALENEFGISHLPADFKKREGYKRSIELSRKYNLYRQDYCGCVYSKRDLQR